jgi:primosomal protein N' (replication factor Y)
MFYYEVAVGGKSKGTQDFFTYESSQQATIGTVVTVLFKHEEVLGFIVKNSSKPSFKTNSLVSISELIIPKHHVSTYLQLCSLYPFSGQSLAQLFLPPQLPRNEPADNVEPAPKPLEPLNAEQRAAFELITSQGSSAFLFGDTGTGKTRVYTHLIRHYLENGKNVILLAPEIGLASYVYQEVQGFTPNSFLYHSNITPKKRTELWKRAHDSSNGLLVVGPRSALTLPLNNVGLIIMDESHDSSYRQERADLHRVIVDLTKGVSQTLPKIMESQAAMISIHQAMQKDNLLMLKANIENQVGREAEAYAQIQKAKDWTELKNLLLSAGTPVFMQFLAKQLGPGDGSDGNTNGQ